MNRWTTICTPTHLARWNLGYVLELLKEWEKDEAEVCDELKSRLKMRGQRTGILVSGKGENVSSKGTENGLLEQFEGYFNLKDVTIEACDENDWPIRPGDFKDRAKGSDPDYQAGGCGDASPPSRRRIRRGDEGKNYAYYEKRTLHGSSLSPSIYSVMGSMWAMSRRHTVI